jgi:predicted nucleotidyltransferase
MPTVDVAQRAADIRRLADAHGVVQVRIFGSRVQGGITDASDLDLLVDLAPDRDLLDLAEFKLDLEDLLGCRVDVVTEAALSPYLRERILAAARPL